MKRLTLFFIAFAVSTITASAYGYSSFGRDLSGNSGSTSHPFFSRDYLGEISFVASIDAYRSILPSAETYFGIIYTQSGSDSTSYRLDSDMYLAINIEDANSSIGSFFTTGSIISGSTGDPELSYAKRSTPLTPGEAPGFGPPYFTNNTILSAAFGKINAGSAYYCLYDRAYPVPWTTQRLPAVFVIDPRPRIASYSCPEQYRGYSLVELSGGNPSPAPPGPQPTQELAGLTCSTDSIPNYAAAVWSNYGSLPTSLDISDTTAPNIAWLQQGPSGSGDRDITVWYRSGTGSLLPKESFTYPGSATGVLLDFGEEVGTLSINSKRGGQDNPFNIFEFSGTQNIAFGKSGVFSATDSISSSRFTNTPLVSSGGITVGSLGNSIGYIKDLEVSLLGRFNGFRLGRAPMVDRKSCGVGFNQCEWSQEGSNLICKGRDGAGGVEMAGCVVSGSGSVYGSGSCVPATNSSGAIIPPNPVFGGYVTLDGSGNVVGSVTPATPADSYFKGVFECGIQKEDSWYATLGKAIVCPVKVAGALFSKTWNALSGASNGFDQIGQVAERSVSGAKIDTTSGSAYTGSNQLIGSLSNFEKSASEHHWTKILKVALMAIFALFTIAFVISLIKNRKF